MPQMGPMSWLFLFFFTSLVYMIFFISIYFISRPEFTPSSTLKLSSNNFLWSW
uniref:ATP synthase complex subunit 8 n=1 Tax=Gondwanalimnadia sp. MT-2020 TaxID=2731355 RepID=A0A6M4SRK1_9CRUS|nr:ATP synthase F0 subunit 8 [Gondwanalimnadia sp. MT-2020]